MSNDRMTEVRSVQQESEREFEAMIATPFAAGGMGLKLSSLFAMLIYAPIVWAVERTIWVLLYRPRERVLATNRTTSSRHIHP